MRRAVGEYYRCYAHPNRWGALATAPEIPSLAAQAFQLCLAVIRTTYSGRISTRFWRASRGPNWIGSVAG